MAAAQVCWRALGNKPRNTADGSEKKLRRSLMKGWVTRIRIFWLNIVCTNLTSVTSAESVQSVNI